MTGMASRPETPVAPGGSRQPSAVTGSAFRQNVARTAVFNVGAALAAGVSGIIIARSLGPSARGDYAAISVWLIVAFTIGDLGLTAATTFFVARDPQRRRDYLATSRVITASTGLAALLIGFLIAPFLARHHPELTTSYRLAALVCCATLLGFGYTAALQAMNMAHWNVVRSSQPVLYLLAVIALWATGRLELTTALIALVVTMIAQSALAYAYCWKQGITSGRPAVALVKPMTRYGVGELANTGPYLVISRLDQIVLAFTTTSAGLGHYAVASSLTNLALPLVSALGHVAFPRLASNTLSEANSALLRRRSILASGGIGIALMAALGIAAPWFVPIAFGVEFKDSIKLIWMLAPAGVFLPCAKVCADLLRGYGQPLSVAYVQGISALVMVALLTVLVPILAERGAAVAASATAAISFLLMLRALLRTVNRDKTETSNDRSRE
jgi:O-antigen/teichoic acid export membrane protein